MSVRLFLCTLLAASTLVNAAQHRPVRMKIDAGAVQESFACTPGVACNSIEAATLLADLHRGEERFLLIDQAELSRLNPNGQCGAGEERYLQLFRIHGGTIVAVQSVLHESCLQNIFGAEELKCSDLACSVEYLRIGHDDSTQAAKTLRSKATFDLQAPEKGIRIVELPDSQ